MPRIRTIKPEFWDDQKLSSISRDARLTFVGLWTYSDDNGVVKAHPLWLKNKIYPYDQIDISDFIRWLCDLESIEAILKYDHEGESFYYIKNFSKHQVINKPNTKNCNPLPPDDIYNGTVNVQYQSGIDTGKLPVGKERKGTGKGKERKDEWNGVGFDEFWETYPIKVAKQQAVKTWEKLSSSGKLPPIEKLVSAISAQKEQKSQLKESGEFCPNWKNPSTWLNGGCWDDECSIPESINLPYQKILSVPDGN